MHNTRRDLLNLKIRTTARINQIDPWNLRSEEVANSKLSSVLLPENFDELIADKSRRGSEATGNVGQ